MTQQSVTFLRVAGHGEVLQKPSQSYVKRLVGEVKIFQKLLSDQLRETISATAAHT